MVISKTNFLVLFIVIITVVTSSFFIYFNIKYNKDATELAEVNNQQNITDALSQLPQEPIFNPAQLNWEPATLSASWEARDSHAVVTYKDKIWLMGGLDANRLIVSPGNVDYVDAPHFSDVWSSGDGINWQLVLDKAPWGQRRSMQLVNFQGKMWLIGGWGPEIGYRSDVWSSEDGINWKLETASAAWPAREGHQLLVFQNKIWLIGGVRYDKHQLFTDVWYSEDGINWVEATKDTKWSPRWDFASTIYNNKIWTTGGMDLKGNLYNDVWSSTDGINWSIVNSNPPFMTRQGNLMFDYKNKLWVIGRLNVSLYKGGVNDVWYSNDGINWQKTETDPLWTGREDVGGVIFNDKIWIIGGMDSNWQWKNDVWYSTF